ncbi:hypothetical protein [Campylobacter sp.]|uniref:hypothetical protein n=1 Tax=Campylobacter sp. TaxID=205 RepID=UPI002A82D5DB|nr:hypothetical protein [Campylobacter sp.]MDY4155197.1 hypothetical protein [Campylobacter sp.]
MKIKVACAEKGCKSSLVRCWAVQGFKDTCSIRNSGIHKNLIFDKCDSSTRVLVWRK